MPTSLARLLADPDDAEFLASVLAAVGDPVSPIVVELQVPDLDAAGERLLAAGHCYSQTVAGTSISVSVGDALTVAITTTEAVTA